MQSRTKVLHSLLFVNYYNNIINVFNYRFMSLLLLLWWPQEVSPRVHALLNTGSCTLAHSVLSRMSDNGEIPTSILPLHLCSTLPLGFLSVISGVQMDPSTVLAFAGCLQIMFQCTIPDVP